MTTAEQLSKGRKVEWPVEVFKNGDSHLVATATVQTALSDDTGAIVVARNGNGVMLGICILADALTAIRQDFPIAVTR